MIYPANLTWNDKVAIIAPAGKIEPDLVDKAIVTLKSWGLEPVCGRTARGADGRYSGTVEDRVADLKWAYGDPSIKAILCTRGGYGAIHLPGHIDPEMISANPKWLIGFSDITLLHAFSSMAGVASLHAPMCKHLALRPDDESSVALKLMLFGESVDYRSPDCSLNRRGMAIGSLTGGNLAVLSGLHSTPFDFDYAGSILFIEDISEQQYKIERMLYTLKYSGALASIKGLIVGQFEDCPDDPGMGMTLRSMIRELVDEYDYPVCFDFPVGHVDHNMPMPVGMMVRLIIDDNGAEMVCEKL